MAEIEEAYWALPTCRVLVVDDDHDLAEAQAVLLETLGQEVRCAHDGDTALRIAIQFHPDLVLLDTEMPGLSGLEVARRLRILRPTRDARLVAQMDGPGATPAVAPPGFDACIRKTGSLAELIAVLRAMPQAAARPPVEAAPAFPRPLPSADSDFFSCSIRD